MVWGLFSARKSAEVISVACWDLVSAFHSTSGRFESQVDNQWAMQSTAA